MLEFRDLPIQFGSVFKAKSFNRCSILMVGLGGPTVIKMTTGGHGMAELPKILFGINEAT